MKVKCDLCEKIEEINHRTALAKKIKYNHFKSYLCDECYDRIRVNTLKRHETGHFQLFQTKRR